MKKKKSKYEHGGNINLKYKNKQVEDPHFQEKGNKLQLDRTPVCP